MMRVASKGGKWPAAATLVDLLRQRAAEGDPLRGYTFLADGEREAAQLGFSDLDFQARILAAALQQQGMEGERALLLYPPGLDFVAAFFGCLYAGAVAVPAYPPRPGRDPRRLRAIAADARPRVVLAPSAGQREALAAAAAAVRELDEARWLAAGELDPGLAASWRPPAVTASSLALLQYTSGSTATPKGVAVRHGNLLGNQELIRRAFGQSAASVIVGWLPLYHDMGLIGNVLQPLYCDARCILMSPLAFLQRPLRWLRAIQRYRATTSGGPDFAYDLCVRKIGEADKAEIDLSSWNVAFNGSEPVRAETLDRFAACFAPCGFRRSAFVACYGLAEATLFVTGGDRAAGPMVKTFQRAGLERDRALAVPDGDPEGRRLVSCGTPGVGHEVAVVEPESRRRVGEGEVGEVWFAGPSVAAGYWQRPLDNAETFGAAAADGTGPFLRTGDLGFLWRGELFLTGRAKDLIIVRGRNHYPQDLELTAAASHPALRPGGAAAFAVEAGGEERVVIAVEMQRLRPEEAPAAAEAVRRAVADEHEIQVYDVPLLRPGTLAKTSSGKVQRHACRAGYLAGGLALVARSALSAAEPERAPEPGEPAVETPPRPGELRGVLALPFAARPPALAAALRREVARAARVPEAALAAGGGARLAALGLDSLAAVELQHVLERELGVELPAAELLAAGDLGELAGLLLARLAEAPPAGAAAEAARKEGPEAAGAAVRRGRPEPPPPLDGGGQAAEDTDTVEPPAWPEGRLDGSLPLSPAQRQLWLFERLQPGTAVYHLAGGVRLSGRLSVAALARSLSAIVARHQALRTRLPAPAGEPVQVVEPAAELVLPLLDLGELPEPRRVAELAMRVEAESRRPFDLESGPLLRLRLFRLGAGEHALLLVVHHLVADGWSLGVLAGELRVLYEALAAGRPPALPPLPVEYAEYVRRQQRRRQVGALAQDLAFWRRQLAGAPPVLELPADRPRPVMAGHRGATLPVALGEDQLAGLERRGRRHGATRFMLFAAAWAAVLSRHARADDLVLGTPVAVRQGPESQGLIGMFVNTLALRLDLGGGPGFGELVERVRERTLAALRHREVPFERLVEEVAPRRDPAHSPLFQVMLALAGREQEGLSRLWAAPLAGLRTAPLEADTGAAKFDLTLTLWPAVEDRGLRGGLEYSRELFDRTTVQRLWSHFPILLARALAAPEARLDELPLLSRAEAHQVLIESNATASAWPRQAGLHHLIEAQARRTPEAAALIWGGRRLSYRQLDQAAGRLAGELSRLGVGPERVVGIFLARTPLLVVALLAVLKAGGAYLPLDPAYPRERLDFLLADSAAAVLLADAATSPLLPAHCGATLRLDEEILVPPAAGGPPPPAAAWAGPEQAAYVIYTSGSTGAPKAVVIRHAGAVALLSWAAAFYGSARLAGVLAATSICFDLSVFEIFAPLAAGGAVVLADHALALPHLASAGEVSLLNTVPSVMAELARAGAPLPARLRTVNLAGEALSRGLAERVLDLSPVGELFNLYGPSEDSTYSTGCRVERAAARVPSIGTPLANRHAFLLDRRLMPVPAGVPGELCLGGEGLARGYRNRPELTAERFRPNPFAGVVGQAGSRLYRTGDLACRRSGGEIEFLGRFDTQVKLRGVRIELGEIEAALIRHPDVREAVVVSVDAASGEAGDRRLVACLVTGAAVPAAAAGAAQGPSPAPQHLARELQQALRETLPDFMVPAELVVWDALPRTATGKVDRRALAERASGQLPARRPYAAPRSDLERTLAVAWADLLHVERVGIHDNFFDLGGNSARGASLLFQISDLFGVTLAVKELFAAPTVAELATCVVRHLVEQADAGDLAAAMDELRAGGGTR